MVGDCRLRGPSEAVRARLMQANKPWGTPTSAQPVKEWPGAHPAFPAQNTLVGIHRTRTQDAGGLLDRPALPTHPDKTLTPQFPPSLVGAGQVGAPLSSCPLLVPFHPAGCWNPRQGAKSQEGSDSGQPGATNLARLPSSPHGYQPLLSKSMHSLNS